MHSCALLCILCNDVHSSLGLLDHADLQKLSEISKYRINPDLEKREGRKVPIMDNHHLWAFLFDPWMRCFAMEIPNITSVFIAVAEWGSGGDADLKIRIQNELSAWHVGNGVFTEALAFIKEAVKAVAPSLEQESIVRI